MRRALLAISLISLASAPLSAQSLVVDAGNSPFLISAASTFSDVTVASGGTLVVNDRLTVTGNMSIASSGTVTHDPEVVTMHLDVAGTLEVQVGGAINVRGKGLGADRAFDPATQQIVDAPGASGGSHGGVGTAGGLAIFGDARNPTRPGGGGGGGGGEGGGYVKITAGTMIVSGTIDADGNASSSQSCISGTGAGAGGGILINAGAFTGAGSLRAVGGVGRGSGGGGRIAVFASTSTFAGTISAVGGSLCGATGGTGTVHVESPDGDVFVQGGNNFIGTGDFFNSITLGPGAHVQITGAATVTETIVAPLGARLTLASTNALDNLSVDPTLRGVVVLDAPFTFTESLRVEGALHVNQALTVQGNLTVATGGTLTHDVNRASTSVTADRIEVEAGGAYNVSGKGLPAGTAFNPATQTNVGAPNAGGSHGGDGGGGSLAVYGSNLDPRTLGSGGTAAAGGGLALIRATDLVINGSVAADGASASSSSCISGNGGGAGGSVNIDVTNLSGSGAVSANGGAGRFGGGGGRVAIQFQSSTYSGAVTARGHPGSCGLPGEDGSIHVESPTNDLVVGSGILELGAGDSYNSVTLGGGATLRLNGPAAVTQPIVIAAGSTLEIRSVDALDNLVIDSTIAGTLVIRAPIQWPNGITIQGVLELVDALFVNGDVDVQAGGLITHPAQFERATLEALGTVNLRVGASFDVSGKGFSAGRAFDPASQQVVNAPAGGGSHGGNGGGTTLGRYGDPQAPLTLGSGGNGGAGGGRVHVVATEIILDGDARANAGGGSTSCISGSGGGAGGSVFLEADIIRGNGTISARGGGGRFAGAGGRVALATPDKQHTGLLQVDAGASSCGFAAEQGSLLLDPEGGTLQLTTGSVTISDLDAYTDVDMASGTTLIITGAATVDAPITVPTGATVRLAASDALTNLEIGQVDGRLEVLADVVQQGSIVIAGRAVIDRTFSAQDIFVVAGGEITHSPGALGMHLIARGVLSVDFDGAISADGLGLAGGPTAGFGAAGATRNPTTGDVASGSGATNGGSHTAQGGLFNGANALAAIFDDAADPVFGGGGGGQGSGGEQGGAGGGVVRIDAGVLIVDGTISADGLAGAADAGGGAGGSVFILADDMSGGGAGRVTAVGGDSAGGAGAGGAVTILFGFSDFAGFVSADGGLGGANGGAGDASNIPTLLAPSIVTTPPTVGAIGVEYVYDAAAVGTRPLTFSLSSAPPGATVDAAEGVVRFTPTAGGLASFTLVATNSAGADTQTFTVQVGAPPAITSTPSTQGFVGVPYLYNAQRTATADGQGPFTWAATLAPAGFTINAASGEIAWTPDSQGTFDVCISVTNGAGSDQGCWQITVGVGSGEAPEITSTAGLVAVRGEAWVYDEDNVVEVTGGEPLSFTLDPAAPGMTIDAAGLLAWTPEAVGTFGVCVVVTNPFGVDTQCFAVDVVAAPTAPRFISTPTVATPVGEAYAYDADGRAEATGPGAIVYAVDEGPAGLTIDADTGLVSYTPDAVGNQPVVLSATNFFGSDTQSFEISVLPTDANAAPVIVHDANLVGAVGQPYAYNAEGAARAGGEGPLTWLLVGAPAGFAIDEASGRVSWTPRAAGPATITLGVNNAFGADTYSFTVEVVEDVPAEPIAIATAAPVEGDAPLTVSFDGTQSFGPEEAPIVTWAWTFGPGEVGATGTTATHTYQTPGSRVARLTVGNIFGARAVDSIVVRVGEGGVVPPSARILISQVEGADELDVSFACECAAGTARIVSTSWDLGDGSVVDSAAFSHTFGPGGYNVRLTVVDENGLTATDEVFIRVADGENAPPLVAALAAPTGGPAPLDVQLDVLAADTDGEIDTLVWTLPDGSTTEERAPALTLDEPGLYEAVVEVIDDGGLASTATVEIEVVAADLARPPQIVSVGAEVALAGQPYAYDADGVVAARGTQPISWSLGKVVGGETVGAPAGMSIDAATGALSWTPEGGGDQEVVIVATNRAGVSVQEFTVAVEGLPDVVVEPEGCGCSASETRPGAPVGAAGLVLLFAALRRRRPTVPGPA